VNEEALAHWEAVAPKTNKNFLTVVIISLHDYLVCTRFFHKFCYNIFTREG
jgi:hypothetical protein